MNRKPKRVKFELGPPVSREEVEASGVDVRLIPDYRGIEVSPNFIAHVSDGVQPETIQALQEMARVVVAEMDRPLRACPLCGNVTTETICQRHGKGMTIYTRTRAELFDALRTNEAGSAGVMLALGALVEAENQQALRMVERVEVGG